MSHGIADANSRDRARGEGNVAAGDLRPAALVWFRRDLRCTDHAALYHALRQYPRVYCVFVFDTEILGALASRDDRRVHFIHASVLELDRALHAMARQAGATGGGLVVRHAAARRCIPELAAELGVQAVFTNRDYEPAARDRDAEVARALRQRGIGFQSFKDQALLDCDEVLNQQGEAYRVFTPYKRAWLQQLNGFQRQAYPVAKYAAHLAIPAASAAMPTLADLGFNATDIAQSIPTGMSGAQKMLEQFLPRLPRYAQARDYPARRGVSYLSVHLRFGTISIRELIRQAWPRVEHGCTGAQTWVSELAWRDFYFMILWHHPYVVERAFRAEFDQVQWDDAPELWAAWSTGRTGYPLVDAAMRQLLQTGYMHNRLRMVVASFLTKDLGIDWRRGERFFARHLNDYDLAANNGGWQWAASTGCDAQPYFRIFNPVLQSRKFDPEGRFIRRYVPELAQVPDRHIHFPAAMKPAERQGCGLRLGVDYPEPVVDHAAARVRTLMRFDGF